jgi:hypothetical protein
VKIAVEMHDIAGDGMCGLAFAARSPQEFWLAEIGFFSAGHPLRLCLYRIVDSQVTLVEESVLERKENDSRSWWQLEVSIQGRDIVASVAGRARVTGKSVEDLAGKIGIYVSGSTNWFDPIQLRGFRVEKLP